MANTLKFGNGEWYGKKDTILAYNDENSNYKPLPFDFSRASKATVVNKDGLIEEVGSGQPRVDYLNNTKGALKLEPSRTNLVTYSEDFSNWLTSGSATSSINTLISPNGTLNADTLNAAISNYSGFYRRFATTIGFSYTNSVFFKKGTQEWVGLLKNNGSAMAAWFNLSNGTIGTVESGVDAKIEDYGNGWYRCSITMNATITNSYIQIAVVDYDNSISNSVVGGAIYAWGAQVEEGSFPTSYIKSNSGSAVTRLTDSCSQTVPDGVIGQTEGVLYAELGSIPSEAIDDVFVELSDGTSNNRILFYADSNGYIRNQIKASGSISSLINTNVTVSSNMKIAITYKSNEAKVFINGVQYGGTDTSVVVPSVNKMNLENYTGTRSETSTLKDLKLYNTALTDQELAALTQV
jgi:hypothetical protein